MEGKALVVKLSEVMQAVERVAKNGRNDVHRYDYATEADITAAVRSELATRHVMMVPTVINSQLDDLQTKAGGVMKLSTLTVRFDLMDGDTGEVVSVTMVGQGSDSGDKAAYKAITGATKYALLKLFLIPTGDDPEHEKTQSAPPPPLTGAQLNEQVLRPAAAPSAGAGAIFPNYGRSKGLPVQGAGLEELEYYLSGARKTLADPGKARFHDKERQLVAAIEAEIARQAA